MRKIIVGAAALAMAALSVTAAPAQQRLYDGQPARVEGGNCNQLAAQLGPARVWQTVFSARGKDTFDQPIDYFAKPCFASEADCRAWLYWARSDWDPYYIAPPPCRTGLPY